MKYTFQKKTVNTVFRVRNIAPDRRTIRIFTYPILWNYVIDLLDIPEISEADIRHSLLKGELKAQADKGFIEVTECTIDLTQFDSEQKTFLQSIGISSGISNTPDAVANISELAALDDSLFDDGTIIGMQSVRDIWQLNKTDTSTADGITIIATNSGTGRWTRKCLGDTSWASQQTWYIDPTSGDDENSGLTQGVAIKTLSELARRWKDVSIDVGITVRIMSDLASGDHPNLRFNIGENGAVLFKGIATEVATGTLTSVTNRNPSGNQPNEIEDTGLSDNWSTLGYVNKRIRLTSGPNAGAVAWIAKDLGSKQARVSSWCVDSEVDLEDLPWEPNPENCEASADGYYIIEDLPAINDMSVDVHVSSTGALYETARLWFEDLEINPAIDRHVYFHVIGERYTYAINRCYVGRVEPVPGGTLPLTNCSSYIPALQNNVTMYVFGGFIRYYANTGMSNEIAIGRAALCHGGIWVWGGKLSLFYGGVCIMETGSYNGVEITAGGICISQGEPIFGDCDTGRGMVVWPGSTMMYQTTKPTLTGTAGDARVGGDSKTWAEIPYINASNGAFLGSLY